MKILLVEPAFPFAAKSKNHKHFLPVGLLKIGAYLRGRDDVQKIRLIRGKQRAGFVPDEIYITSLFTYWSSHFWDTVKFYRECHPDSTIRVGGIYVSLNYRDARFRELCEEWGLLAHHGVLEPAESYPPDYSLLTANPHPIDYQIMHASRGCTRQCRFCGVSMIEPRYIPKKSILNEITHQALVFYDNNLLANPFIENILGELVELKKKKKITWCEAQSGFDVTILLEKPHLGGLLKRAGFRYPRIAWDWGLDDAQSVRDGIGVLRDGGYKTKEVFVFMLFNWEFGYEVMEEKRLRCWQWGVQIADCRFRPLDCLHDGFSSRREQTPDDYFIHPKWTDARVKAFRKNVRRHNICIRQGLRFYSSTLEHKNVSPAKSLRLRSAPLSTLHPELPDAWLPSRLHPPPDSPHKPPRFSF